MSHHPREHVSSNTVSESGHNGFWIAGGSTRNAFTGNVATDNHDNGFAVWTGSNGNRFTANVSSDSETGSGFAVYAASGNTFVDSNVSGFWIAGGASRNTVTGNISTANDSAGFELYQADHNALRQNVATTMACGGSLCTAAPRSTTWLGTPQAATRQASRSGRHRHTTCWRGASP